MQQSPRNHYDTALLLPGDFLIDETSITLFDVLDLLVRHRSPPQIQDALRLTPDQLALALDYHNTHRAEVERAYREAKAGYVQRILHALMGVHHRSWRERSLLLGLFLPGLVCLSISISQFTWLTALIGSILCVMGVLGLHASLQECYTFTNDDVSAAHYGRKPEWSIPNSAIADIRLGSGVLTFLSDDGRQYDLLCTESMRQALDQWYMDEQQYREQYQE